MFLVLILRTGGHAEVSHLAPHWIPLQKRVYICAKDPGDMWPNAVAVPLASGWGPRLAPMLEGSANLILDRAYRAAYSRVNGTIPKRILDQLRIIFDVIDDGLARDGCAGYLGVDPDRSPEPIKVRVTPGSVSDYIAGLTGDGADG